MNKLIAVTKQRDSSNFKYKSFVLKTLGFRDMQGKRIAKKLVLTMCLCFKKPTARDFEFGLEFPLSCVKSFYEPIELGSKEFKREFKLGAKLAKQWLAQHQPF